ncbi:MAG: hypothetical protein GQ531_11230 [Sulfurovum sp.]|nr:hypothetical protein [Sulfurovum sp.]
MHDHNLDDLIIDTVAPKNNKAKGFLTIVALFIVIIIVMIILNKTFINPEQNKAQLLDEELTTAIAPELKLQETVPEPQAPTETIEPVVEVTEEPSLPNRIEEKITAPVEPEPKVVETIELPTTELPVVTTPEPVQTKPEVVAPIPTPVAVPVTEVKTPKPTPVAKGAYFIQVGSYRQQPSPSFIQKIQNNGFTHTLSKPNSKGIKKLLIGPYTTRAEVDNALLRVRDRVLKQAFVVKK